MRRENCWERLRCGRGPGGSKVHELGLCPAATTRSLDSVHGGQAAGRACWVVAGTLCTGKVEGSFASKFRTCAQCTFYLEVRAKEYPAFKLAGTLLNRMEESA